MAEAEDIKWMTRALQLAALSLNTTLPNPMVGCVIIKEGKVLSEGWHKKYGGPHAEVEALKRIPESENLSNATAYVTLEPCSHFGKTPPCADLLIKRGVGKVVSAMEDPNPQVCGRGHNRLKENGIEVHSGILEEEAKHLNRAFIKLQSSSLPYITLKWAQSSDGFIDPDSSPKAGRGSHAISSTEVNQITHQLRATNSAILIGRKTAEIDNPRLSLRTDNGCNPIRLIIDPELKLDPNKLKLTSQEGLSYFICNESTLNKHEFALPLFSKNNGLREVLEHLRSELNIHNILVEGGSATHQKFIETNLWNEAWVVTSKNHLNSGVKAPSIKGLKHSSSQHGTDTLKVLLNHD